MTDTPRDISAEVHEQGVGEQAFYCFYCDENSALLICGRCGNTARPITPIKDAYYLKGNVN